MTKQDYDQICQSATRAASILQRKWRIPILCAMQRGPVRLGLLLRLLPHASKKVMTDNLRQLVKDRVVVRTDFSGIQLHVEYEYSEEFRMEMIALMKSLAEAGQRQVKSVDLSFRP